MSLKSSKSKAGISWPVQERTSDPLAQFFQPGSKLSWHYNWNKNWDIILPETSPNLSLNAEFVPMIFAPGYFDNDLKLQEGYTHVLGFNEPDHSDPAVAQLATPEKAAEEWKKIAALRNAKVKLISPAVAGDINWLKCFINILPPDARPDYIAVHVYSTTFEAFKAKIEEYWNTFNLPIWLTEFAMTSFDPNVPPPTSMQQVHDFMGQATAWLDETDYISRYAWFGACRNGENLHGVHPFNRLMDEQGRITALGHQYINGGHD